MVGGAVARGLLGGLLLECGALHAVGDRELHAHDVEVVVTDFTADGHHVLHLLAAHVAELALLHHRAVGPDVGDGVLDEGRRDRDARQIHGFQTSLVDYEVAN